MPDSHMNISRLTTEIEAIYEDLIRKDARALEIAGAVRPEYHLSALNLLRYLALRSYDLRKLHDPLSELGLSSLRSAEGYVLHNLKQVLGHLKRIQNTPWSPEDTATPVGFQGSRDLLAAHREALFGSGSGKGRPEIMVTLSRELGEKPGQILEMIQSGMGVARINLARDEEANWERMLESLKWAEAQAGKRIPVYMDLAGPKIRIRFPAESQAASIPVAVGSRLLLQPDKGDPDAFRKALDAFPTLPVPLTLSLPEILEVLEEGDPVSFHDGRVRAIVRESTNGGVLVEVTATHQNRLKKDKGMNVPGKDPGLPSLTEDDLALLPYIASRADMLGYSFVNRPEDVTALYAALAPLGAENLGVVLKVETQSAFANLPAIIIEGMKRKSLGVMVARGDLAVEVGFDRISEVQHEILWICEAAHIPVIWATQVLDTLAKKGMATRAEISDASLGTRAECIMLNKGRHILEAIRILGTILDRMKAHVSKKKDISRSLDVARQNLRRFYETGE